MWICPNGVKLYYEVRGQGKPVLLLHGNGEDHRKMAGIAALLEESYTVYSLDSRDHGQSARVSRLSYDDMAEDVARMALALSLEKPLIIGSSDGAIIALLVAIRYPELPGGVISAGANRNPEELRGWFRAVVRLGLWGTRGDPKLALMLNEPNLTDEMLAQIKAPVLVMAGQRDIVAERYTRALAAAIPGAALRILPGETHSSYIAHAERLLDGAHAFLAKYRAP